ncbi:hypothetical protein DAERI_020330 [Deinococcus aerius]|uniref:Uncharacterized protein n=1 Tax=Deinococcus aerius TaxID=200253 RepID=A0A2I9CSQ9_9DEIO|nr:hypothetical protein [Deinococcus aerius]GBF04733.1 hypothetical protein DAERI_020330 [Deinococcus aerius]
MTDAAPRTLRAALDQLPTLPVPPHARARRGRLADHIRATEGLVLRADDPGALAAARASLGWDDAALHRFVESGFVIHTSPHASMNAFGQRACYSWLARRVMDGSAREFLRPIQLRTSLTHNNLGDLKWRPYAWWRRDGGGRVVKDSLFSRNHAVRHKTLLSQPPVDLLAITLSTTDTHAARLASVARNHAYQCVLYRAALEHLGGCTAPGGAVEVPFDLLNRFALADSEVRPILVAAARASGMKVIGPDGELAAVPDPGDLTPASGAPTQYVGSNEVNFVLTYLLAPGVVIGGSHMAEYAPAMHGRIHALYASLGLDLPVPSLLPVVRFPVDHAMPVDPEGRRVLDASSVPNTLAIAVADHGAGLARLFDRLLDEPAGQVLGAVAVFGGAGTERVSGQVLRTAREQPGL